jgi:hypothetical protein
MLDIKKEVFRINSRRHFSIGITFEEIKKIRNMKKIITFLLLVGTGFAMETFGQYCMLPGEIPYSPQQPGITFFGLNTISRTSGNSESSSSVVKVTGVSTTITPGQTYTISITHSEDAQFFPGARNNLRVWIDYNSNFSFLDAGETVLSADLVPPLTTYTLAFTVPAGIPPGTLTLRATAKMSSDAGHTIPTPCNVPADPIGYHGEIEDYLLVVEAADPGQEPLAGFSMSSETLCTTANLTLTNTSTGTPTPTYSWSASPSGGVTFSPNNTDANPTIKFSNAGTYSIVCTASNSVDAHSAGKTVTVSVCSTVGLAETNPEPELHFWPNPANRRLNVKPPENHTLWKLSIFNAIGAVVLEVSLIHENQESQEIDLSPLSSGLYFVRTEDRGFIRMKPLIIEKDR